MRGARPITTASVAAGVVVFALGLALRITMGRAGQDRLSPDERVGIAALRSPLPQPSFLACPPGYCLANEAMTSPVFDMPWERLRDYWTEMIAAEQRVVPVADHQQHRRLAYISQSPVFRFPDIVTVEFVALAPGRSSIAIFSRSRYGRYDFQKNRKRIERWLSLLQTLALPATPSSDRAP